MFSRSVLVLAALAVADPLLAAEEEEHGPWAGMATLGYLATSGNTNNSNLNTGLEVSYSTGMWQHLFNARAINATEDDQTTAAAFELGWKSERSLSENNFLFGRLNWRKDRFSGYDTQFSQTVGYGRRLIDREGYKLNAEIGVGARQSDLIDGSQESETILRGGLHFTWTLSETAEFRQGFVVESGSSNTYSEAVTALSSRLIGNLALVASFTAKNNSEVPQLTEKTDTYTALSLEYSF